LALQFILTEPQPQPKMALRLSNVILVVMFFFQIVITAVYYFLLPKRVEDCNRLLL